MTAPVNSYGLLETRFRRLSALQEAAGMLHWDMATVMPDGGRSARAEQLATIEVICHEVLTAPETADLLDSAEMGKPALNAWQRANLAEMRRTHTHATALDAQMVEAMSRAVTACEAAWRVARPKGDFAGIYPLLSEVLNLTRQSAVARAEKLGCSPYEALMDRFEPGAREAEIDAVFADYGAFLPEFLGRVLEHQASLPKLVEPKGPFPQAVQKDLAKRIMAQLGFDFDHGRLDESLHPFCGGVPEDVRITTRYNEDEFVQSLMGVIHETGHALYERHLPADWRLQPVGQARGMVIHESQSLLMEMQACRSAAFCKYLSGQLRQTFPGNDAAFTPDNLRRIYSRVQPGFIRVEADELTYDMHIMLRVEIEAALLDGSLKVAELPEAWNAIVKRDLGLDVPDDRRGVLQDVHWSSGSFGSFCSYTIGNVVAAQLMDTIRRTRPEIPAALAAGNYAPLKVHLNEAIHRHGRCFTRDELLTRATGRKLDWAPYVDYLRGKVADVYRVAVA